MAGQLYHSVTPWAHDRTRYDLNWHWYGPDGYRVITHVRTNEPLPFGKSYDVGFRTFFFYDGADVTLTVRREGVNGAYKVFQRYLTGGVDQQLAARINGISTTRSVALVADIQGSTIKLLKDDLVTVDCDPSLTVRGPFGAAVTAQAGLTSN